MDNNKTNILVIDDEKEVRDLLKEFLEEKKFSVSLAADGLQAQEHFKAKVPDIVIIDLLLPGEHGINLVKTIKEKYFVPLIIISGIYSRDEIKDTIEEYFVEGFFEKPLNLDKLLEKINDIINERAV
jgi:DNA-binding NtrC family response regulator